MPASNSEQTIAASILSVVAQTEKDWEIVVVDDCSTDSTSEVVRKLMQVDPRIRLVGSKKQLGTGRARAMGVQNSRADVIAFLDSDDISLPHRLEEGLEFLHSQNSLWIHNSFRYLNSDLRLSAAIPSHSVKSFGDLLGANPITLSAVMLQKTVFPLDLAYAFSGANDLELWFALAKAGFSAEHSGSANVIYRIRRGSVSSNKFKAALRRIHNIKRLQLGLVLTCYSHLLYVAGSIKKYAGRYRRDEDSLEIGQYLAHLQKEADTLTGPSRQPLSRRIAR